MQIHEYDLYAYQLLHFLVVTQHYHLVRVQHQKNDLWLVNEKHTLYPVIRISIDKGKMSEEDINYVRNIHRILLTMIHREGKMLVLNTNKEAVPTENPYLLQVVVNEHSISDSQICSCFQGIEHVLHPVNQPQEEIAKLMRQIEEAERKQQKAFIRLLKKKSLPKATIAIGVVCFLWMLVTSALTFLLESEISAWIASGAYYKMNVVAAHEYWRLFTAGFVHMNIFHFIMDMYILYLAGKLCENRLGRKNFVFIFLLSIILGNLATLIAQPNGVSMGIGTGIFGVVTTFATIMMLTGSYRHPILRIPLYQALGVLILGMLLPEINLVNTLMGMLVGILAGMWIHGSKSKNALYKHTKIASILLGCVLVFLGFRVNRVEPLDKQTDQQIIKIYENTPLQAYGDYLEKSFMKQYEE